MPISTAAPDPGRTREMPTRAPWEADPDAWKGQPTETPAEAVERLLEEVSHG